MRKFIALPGFWIKITEFILGMICYGLTYYYGFVGSSSLVLLEMGVVAAVAFPMVILPACIIAISLSSKNYYHTAMDPIFSFAGAVCYLIQWLSTLTSMTETVSSTNDNFSAGVKAMAAFLGLTGIIFFSDYTLYFYFRIKHPHLLQREP